MIALKGGSSASAFFAALTEFVFVGTQIALVKVDRSRLASNENGPLTRAEYPSH